MFIILFEYIYITRVLFRTLFKKMYLNLLFLTLLETNLTDTCIYTPVYRLIETFGDKGKITDCTQKLRRCQTQWFKGDDLAFSFS